MIEESGDVYRFDGFSDCVNINNDYNNVIITHNHSDLEEKLGGSFGKDEFNLLLKHQEIKESRVIDGKYSYIIRTLKPLKESNYDDEERKN